MAEVVVSKTVFFIGAWRTQEVTEKLLKQIASSLTSKKGFSTTLTLSQGGLELLIHDKAGHVTRTDKIPLQDIIDFIGSKYSKTCIHAVVKDRKNQFTVFVFSCSSERDAGDMVQTFTMIKKRLSGEGYNLHLTPKGTNWMLKTKADSETGNVEHVSGVTVTKTENVVINGGNTEGNIGEVRVLVNGDARPIVDNVSHHTNDSELKDELIHLSDEVKAIKLMIENQQPNTTYGVQQQGYRIVTEAPKTGYRIEQQEYNVTQEPKSTYQIQQKGYRIVQEPQSTFHVKQEGYEIVKQPKAGYQVQQREYEVVQEPRSNYQIQQQAYQVVQEPEKSVHVQSHVVQQPLYQNTTGDRNVVYHLETMAEQPTIKTQTIYTKNQRNGSRREYNGGAGGYYVMRGRTDTGHSKAGSNISTAHSTKSYYTRRRYDSPNPMVDKQFALKQVKNRHPASMKYLTTKETRGVHGKHALLYNTFSSDKVLKNIEDVYKNRISFRKHAAVPVIVNKQSAEYANVSQISPSGSKKSSMKVVVSPGPEVGHVKPLQREMIQETIELKEGEMTKGDAALLQHETSGFQQSGHIVDTGYVNTGYVNTGHDSTGYVNTTVQENTFILEPATEEQKVYTTETVGTFYTGGSEVQHGNEIEGGDEVIVIKAEGIEESREQPGYTIVENTEAQANYTATQNPEVSVEGSEGYGVTYVNQGGDDVEEKVIHIKAETSGAVRYVRDYQEVEVIDTRTDEEKNDAERQIDDESSARNSANVIIREEYIRSPSDFQSARDSFELSSGYNGEVRRVTSNNKRVHYMEELQQNIGERPISDIERQDSDIEIKIGFESKNGEAVVENNNNDELGDSEEKYTLDTEKLKEYTKEPEIVIVEREVKVADNFHQNVISDNDLQRTEDTVLF